MEKNVLFEQLKEKFLQIAKENDLLDEKVSITGRALTTEEAIGNPDRQDFPIVKGKEKLLQAEIKGFCGQAFTDMPGYFEGTLQDIINRPLSTNFNMAVFVATLNAVMRYLGLVDRTIHCKDNEPEDCAAKLVDFMKENYGDPKIALVGFQPSFLESLAPHFAVRVLDLDVDRIGKEKFGVLVEDGETAMEDVLSWCDMIFATGSTLANGTIVNFMGQEKETIFFGTTVAGAAHLLGLKRYCECAK